MKNLSWYGVIAGFVSLFSPPVLAQSEAEQSEDTTWTSPTAQYLEQFWELGEVQKRGTFTLRTYNPNYVLPYHHSDNINQVPESPTRGQVTGLPEYQDHEMKIQLSFRTKILEDFLLPNGDLWMSYSQTSLWQAWNSDQSSPFRSTDHNPDVFYVAPVAASYDIIPGNWRLRMVKFGLAHESNGQSKPSSRSWNYWYVGGVVQMSNFVFETTYKTRVNETLEDDDNPDLTDYRGNVETRLTAMFDQTSVAVTRHSPEFSFDRGNWQLDITHPLIPGKPEGVRVHLQLFSGYGESLIDYNHKQNRIGIGFVLINI
ncbi:MULTISPECIES: phospholipase A [Gammaproteobacteria]|uniref:phospholipase A n=1 Tax=Gammaproteobacteria TaxID=1236 RepID=UPI000DD0D221|nr:MULTISPECIES: phospholipase A [Gammaproteobacteria]RTE85731.1 phospholipase [Aliidiomarina sp. B3213]TCZ90267.1 phospholipase [Lysobacter sp. N42]